MLIDNVGEKGQKFFPFIFVLFSFVTISNLIGLIPYSFTITSHLIITVGLSILVFINNVKIGMIYGLFVEAFKLGS